MCAMSKVDLAKLFLEKVWWQEKFWIGLDVQTLMLCACLTPPHKLFSIALVHANTVEDTIGCVETSKHTVGLTLGIQAHINVSTF